MAEEPSIISPDVPKKEKEEDASNAVKNGEAEIHRTRPSIDELKSSPEAADGQDRAAAQQSAASPVPGNGGQSSDAATHPAYYSDILYVEIDKRLDFKRAAGPQAPPIAYRQLRRQIEDVARLVRILFQDDKARLNKFFAMLHITADSGLRGPNSSLEIGADNLQDVKDSIADEFPAVRGKIWWWNFGILVATAAVCGLAAGVLHYTTGSWIPTMQANSIWPSLKLAAFLIPLGVVIGLFVEFIFRVSDDVPYEQLRAINPGRWKPFQRAFNTVLVAYIFAGMLGVGAFQVGVASVLLNDFIDKKPELSLAIGFVSGFAFPYVRDLVQQFHPVKRESNG
jgi:hypothetical protein